MTLAGGKGTAQAAKLPIGSLTARPQACLGSEDQGPGGRPEDREDEVGGAEAAGTAGRPVSVRLASRTSAEVHTAARRLQPQRVQRKRVNKPRPLRRWKASRSDTCQKANTRGLCLFCPREDRARTKGGMGAGSERVRGWSWQTGGWRALGPETGCAGRQERQGTHPALCGPLLSAELPRASHEPSRELRHPLPLLPA